MERLRAGCGWTVLCVLTTVGFGVWAQDTPKTTENKNASDSKPEADSKPAAVNTPAAPVPAPEPEAVQEPMPVSPAAPTETKETTQQPAVSSAGPATAPETAAAAKEKTVEIVPEAITTDTAIRPIPHIEIQPSVLPQETSDGEKKILVGSWTKSILFTADDNSFRFQPRGWVQPKFALSVNPDKDHNDDEPFMGSGFSLQRARFGFQAWLFKWGHFYLDTDWKTGAAQLVDYFVDLGPNNGDGSVGVRLGFFRPYLSRQLLHSVTQLTMIDYARAWTDSALNIGFGPGGRQLGIAVQGFVKNGIEYGVGIWNGEDGYTMDADFMYGGRIAIHPMGLAGGASLRPGDESDTSISRSPAMSIGVAAYLEDRNDAASDLPGSLLYKDHKLKAGADAAFKIAGVSLEAEFFLVKTWAEQVVINDYLELYHRDAPGIGTYFQAAYMIVPKRFEIAGRFDMVDENTDIRGIRFYPSVGVTYYLFGNNLKAQFQYRINIGAGYIEDADAMYMPITHDYIFMLQASI